MSKSVFEKTFGVPFPAEYVEFLALSNGLETQRGCLFNAASILKWNNEHWRRTPSIREISGGVVIESVPTPRPPPIDYVWIGFYGNMDMYCFHVALKKYRVTNLAFDHVYAEFEQLAEFLLYVADPSVQLA